ncbi:hypothetical protein F4553_006881 [Allocatelliglobosispora scoriae]|uniref:Uncharacterized protein n=1 Tax=Allocatelliglobosispora scoriae TaxID=643052 RepID=A0A841BWG0_9ACTN|nr:hypothetical protein [Allocatelliglobosispora scoriae]MBB5873447.1 hypothetical protein [Allocatelliglobosispora scoriae]
MLTETLARALVDLIVTIDLSDDDEISPEAGSAILGDVAAALNSLSASDTDRLVNIIGEMAAEEDDPVRKETMIELPETLGLVD